MRATRDFPLDGWEPRWYQEDVWNYLTENRSTSPTAADNKHAELIWHRRAGKDDICLRLAAREMLLRPATYWHMLPKKEQIKKAIWTATNPHSGTRRIYEAFPKELFTHNESDMTVKCKINDSIWQCLGSDNYDTAVGSPPRGVTYSEWALANPSARGYIRPIITENNGYQVYISTPRGKNHAYRTFNAALKSPNQFGQKLTVHDTGILSPERLQEELLEYVSTYGEAYGISLFEQEYECSFDAAILGAYWGDEFKRIDREGRICDVQHDPNWPVHVSTDLGRTDDLSIWWYQVIANEIRVLEHYAASGDDPDTFCSVLLGKDISINIIDKEIFVTQGEELEQHAHRKAYEYGEIRLPHDGAAKTFAAKGKSVQEQLAAVFGWGRVRVTPNLSKQDQIQAGRKALRKAYFDWKCETDNGIDALRSYHREWDDEKKKFADKPEHDWTSHPSDAWMQAAIAYEQGTLPEKPEPMNTNFDPSFNDLIKKVRGRNVDAFD